VLLLDEIEKAHPDIYNVLLQVMDTARLTDNNGREADFRNVILIMTSNAGAAEMSQNVVGFGKTVDVSRGLKAIEKAFAPEFRNRLDGVVMFDPLAPEVMEKIVDKFVDELELQLADKQVTVTLTDAARAFLGEEGYDEKLGARPLSRVIQDRIKQPLANEILFGELQNGGEVEVDWDGEEVHFAFDPLDEDEEKEPGKEAVAEE
jgi:ATP-dependent Clp protease ATP-binding subunit ClpA